MLTCRPVYCPYGAAAALVLTFREAKVSREVRLLSTGRARGLQLENGCSERPNPQGFKWDFIHTGCTHIPTHILYERLHFRACIQTYAQIILADSDNPENRI